MTGLCVFRTCCLQEEPCSRSLQEHIHSISTAADDGCGDTHKAAGGTSRGAGLRGRTTATRDDGEHERGTPRTQTPPRDKTLHDGTSRAAYLLPTPPHSPPPHVRARRGLSSRERGADGRGSGNGGDDAAAAASSAGMSGRGHSSEGADVQVDSGGQVQESSDTSSGWGSMSRAALRGVVTVGVASVAVGVSMVTSQGI